jgi:hypothetical protein
VSTADAALPRLLYIGDVAVADTMGGEALLFRLLQYYPPTKLAVVCGVRPGMPTLPGVRYHHHGVAWQRLMYTRIAGEYELWNAWRYYQVPRGIANVARQFKPEAILSISHVSAWLAASQLAPRLGVPLHLIAHDDFVYASRFPAWARGWAERRFGEAYRAAAGRFCISDTMEEIYRSRFGAAGAVIYPTHKGSVDTPGVSERVARRGGPLTFGYGGSINSASDMDQIVAFARVVTSRGHRLIAFTPQHAQLASRASSEQVFIETHQPLHSDAFLGRLRAEADCLLLPQSLVVSDRAAVASAFPTKWADYATLGLPVIVWAPPGSSSARFVADHPGCAALVTSSDPEQVDGAVARVEDDLSYRRSLAEHLLVAGRAAFSPQAAWQKFSTVLRDRYAGG